MSRIRTAVQVALLAAACIHLSGAHAGAQGDPLAMTIENEAMKWEIGADGLTWGLIDKASGQNWSVEGKLQPVATVAIGGKLQACTSASAEGDRLSLGFGETGAKVVLRIQTRPRYVTVTVEAAHAPGLEQLRFLDILTGLQPSDDEAFALSALALNLQTNVPEMPGRNKTARASCYPRFGCEGAAVALVACPYAQMRETLKQVITETGTVPRSPTGGPWAMDGKLGRASYLFMAPTLANVDDIIATVKSVGFNQVQFHGGAGSYRFGDCLPNPKLYPNGVSDIKAVIEKLHAAGIAIGMHPYAFFIDKACPWVTPVPDKRLKADAEFTLSADLSVDAATVPVNETTAAMSTITGFFVRNSVTLHVDDELIVYRGLSKEPPYAFTSCQRGALGTRAAPHKAGAKVRHLSECFGLFVPDPETTLLEEVAQVNADFYNECNFDSLYLDALDGEDVLGGSQWSWHYGSKFVWELWKRLDHPAAMEYSTFHHHLWPLRSRHGAWDSSTRAHRHFIDSHVAANSRNERMFLPSNLGWWAFNSWRPPQVEPTFREDVEYWCAKAIGTDSGLSLQGYDPNRPAHQRLAAIVRQCEDLRHAGYFPASVKQQLRRPGKDFTLEQDQVGGWRFREASYAAERISLRTGAEEAWTVENPFDAQPLALRIEALMACGTYEAENTVTLAAFDRPDEFTREGLPGGGCAPGVTMELETVGEGEQAYGRIRATNNGKQRFGAWAGVGKTFPQPLDLSATQGLGVWVLGDGKGEVINFQLSSPEHLSHAYGDHYVVVDFEGWRYFELVELDSSRHHLFGWPYPAGYAVYRETVRPNAVARLRIWVGNLPPGDSILCDIRPVKALPLVSGTMSAPSVGVGGNVVTFPVTMESGAYLEYDGGAAAQLYASDGRLLEEVAPHGNPPAVASGPNRLSFSAQGFGCAPRAKVTVVTRGEPVQ